jgi:hypothetical protein
VSDLGTTDGTIKRLEQQITELKAMVNDLLGELTNLSTSIQCYMSDEDADEEDKATLFSNMNDDLLEALKTIKQTPTQSLKQHDYEVIMDMKGHLTFPTMLRKMWSGNDVQTWLNHQIEAYAKNKQDGEDA